MDPHDALDHRLARIERRLTALENQSSPASTAAPETPPNTSDPFWAITALRRHIDEGLLPQTGGVSFAGAVNVHGHEYEYQWDRALEFFVDTDWTEAFERLAALAHPVRAHILKRLLAQPATAADLVADATVSSTGAAYHHLNALHSAGWITKQSGGLHEVRPQRVIPLLAVVAATEDH